MDSNRLRMLAGVAQDTTTKSGVLLENIQKPKPGQAFGANDQAAPEDYTEDQLSRVADLLYCASQVGGKELAQTVFKALDRKMKGEFNYANWKYVAPKQ